MALPIKINALSEVEESLRIHYVKREDGTYILDGVEDVSGLKSALSKERENAGSAAKRLKELSSKYEGIDVEEVRKLQQEAEALKSQKLLDAGKVDELLAQRTEKMRTEHESALQKMTQHNESLRSSLERELIDNRLMSEGGPLGVQQGAFEDLKLRGRQVFRLTEQGEVLPYKGDQVVYGQDGTTPLSIKEWISDLQKTSAHLFTPSSGGNIPPGSGQSGAVGNTFTMSREQARTDFSGYKTLKEEAAKAGQTVTLVE